MRKKKRIILICQNCGREFEIIKSRENTAKFCCYNCCRKGRIGEKYPKALYPNYGMRGKVPWNKGLTKETDERVAKISRKVSKKLKGKVPWNKDIPCSEETKKKIGNGNRNKIVSEETKKKQSKAHLKQWKDPEYREKSSKAREGNQATKGMKFPEEKYPNFGTRNWKASKETKKKQSEIGKIHWQDPEYQKLMFESHNARPNGLEKYYSKLIGGKIRFVGDYIFHIRTKNGVHNPDFKVTGQKKIIELFGNYWHKGEDPNELIKEYSEAG